MNSKVILFGATGMVGEGVLLECLRRPDVESVLVIGRRPCELEHPKLTEIIHKDFYDLSPIENRLRGYDACFFCLGVSSIGMSKADYTRVTYDLTMHVAGTLSRLNPAMTICYVSGVGTDSTERGRSMWARVKGKTENHLMLLPFKGAYMFRPGYIQPTKGLRRTYRIYKALEWLNPVLKRVFPRWVCTLEDIGNAMINVSIDGYHGHILEIRDIVLLGRKKPASAAEP
jgi:uncharacterized protein YbjT (DUF2867 family)